MLGYLKKVEMTDSPGSSVLIYFVRYVLATSVTKDVV